MPITQTTLTALAAEAAIIAPGVAGAAGRDAPELMAASLDARRHADFRVLQARRFT
jgi:hypothetical protein